MTGSRRWRTCGLLALAGTLALAGCATSADRFAPTTLIGPVSAIVVTGDAQGPATDDCGSYRVTPAMVEAFFHHAMLLTRAQLHDDFALGACYAQGSLQTRHGRWQWELRNLGTGTLTAVTGEVFVLGDPRQASPLGVDGRER